MKEKQFDLTRRRVLGGLGTIGIASAAAGLGTSAYFSDTETYTGNTLTAGSLDLKVDWEEHYSDWSDDEMVMIEDGNGGSMDGVRMSKPSDPANWIGMPDPANPLLYVHSNALQEFMTRTALEAYPDDGDNGTQSLHRYGENQYCDILADAPDDLDPNRSNPARTLNDDTYDSETDTVKPLVSLDDVKPGDFGELTLSFHLCDNPGYIWMQGELVNASENGHTEPEAEDPDEEGGPNTSNSTGNDVEILDAIQTLAWYDEDLDNVYEPAGETGKEVDVMLVLDRSGSMGTGSGSKLAEQITAAKNLVDALNLGSSAAQVGVVSFSDQESLDQGLTTDAAAAKSAIEGISNLSHGSTNLEGGVNGAEDELTGSNFSSEVSPSGNARSGADQIMVVLSDGAPNVNDNQASGGDTNDSPVQEATRAKNNNIELYTIGFDVTTSAATTLENMASDPKNTHFYTGGTGTLTQIFGQISQQIAGEEKFFQGSLKEFLATASSGNGIPLDGDRSTAFDEVKDPDDSEARDCFVASTNNAVGLAWWLPPDHANEIQSDSVEFDLGFYTEQCRHNDGSGLTSKTTTTTTTTTNTTS